MGTLVIAELTCYNLVQAYYNMITVKVHALAFKQMEIKG
jgi:hypothetical protein